jgi:hypothetical protein
MFINFDEVYRIRSFTRVVRFPSPRSVTLRRAWAARSLGNLCDGHSADFQHPLLTQRIDWLSFALQTRGRREGFQSYLAGLFGEATD